MRATQGAVRLTELLTKKLSRRTANPLGVSILLISALAVIACDEGADITYVNMTDKTLRVYVDGLLLHTLEPSESREALILRFSRPKLFEAKRKDGTVVFSERLSWGDLKAREFRLVFTSAMSP